MAGSLHQQTHGSGMAPIHGTEPSGMVGLRQKAGMLTRRLQVGAKRRMAQTPMRAPGGSGTVRLRQIATIATGTLGAERLIASGHCLMSPPLMAPPGMPNASIQVTGMPETVEHRLMGGGGMTTSSCPARKRANAARTPCAAPNLLLYVDPQPKRRRSRSPLMTPS